MSSIDFAALRAEVPMAKVLELLNYEPRATQGDQLRGACPVHGSTSTTSRIFSVNLARNNFQCFKCKVEGNQLDLWAQVHELTVYDAALDLCSKLGIEPPPLGGRQQ